MTDNILYGAIIGDIVGSTYEFDRGPKTTDFPLFRPDTAYTDDTVLTLAIAKAIMNTHRDIRLASVQTEAELQRFAHLYPRPMGGYGTSFSRFINTGTPAPDSCGNGAAMRISPVGWAFNSLDEVERWAEAMTVVTHKHPEAIKGAQAVASTIFLARHGSTKTVIKNFVTARYGYNLSKSCDDIRPNYYHVETCQETVPEALTAFLEGKSFTDVIRLAVSLGGDSDTLTAIAGSMAEAYYYPVSRALQLKANQYLPRHLRAIRSVFSRWTGYAVE